MNNTIVLEDKCQSPKLDSLKSELLIESPGNHEFLLDFSAVENPDIRSVQLLMSFSNDVKNEGGKINSKGISDSLNAYFDATGTGDFFSN